HSSIFKLTPRGYPLLFLSRRRRWRENLVSEVCMQQDPIPTEPMITRPKWMRQLKINNQPPIPLENEAIHASPNDITVQPTLSMKTVIPTPTPSYGARHNHGSDPFHMQLDTDISDQITAHLMKLSGRIPATPVLRPPQQNDWSAPNHNNLNAEEGYWPDCIQQTGPF